MVGAVDLPAEPEETKVQQPLTLRQPGPDCAAGCASLRQSDGASDLSHAPRRWCAAILHSGPHRKTFAIRRLLRKSECPKQGILLFQNRVPNFQSADLGETSTTYVHDEKLLKKDPGCLQSAQYLVIVRAMEFLDVSHSAFLTAMSFVVALVAGFTGLSSTRDLSEKPMFQKKASVALASVALGGGIWAMHFVAMLGMKLPILFYYDAAVTLVSALTAILLVGAALILLHFTERTPKIIAAAGGIVGVGILAMHYIGMAGLELCRAIFTASGVALSSVVAIGLCILAFWIAYGRRTKRNILLGTVCFAAAVCAVHFLAMAGTNFVAEPNTSDFGPSMSNETLALGVIFFSFVIFGACLWVSVTYLVADDPRHVENADAPETPPIALGLQIPCEKDGGKVFIRSEDVSFLRADGHYTQVYTDSERLFCAWPVTEALDRLLPLGFLQTHRSYLVNPSRVSRFERTKDKGRCIFDGSDLPPAPVSRSKLKAIQDALASQVSAIRA